MNERLNNLFRLARQYAATAGGSAAETAAKRILDAAQKQFNKELNAVRRVAGRKGLSHKPKGEELAALTYETSVRTAVALENLADLKRFEVGLRMIRMRISFF